MLKTVEPALRKLMAMDDFNVQGFLCPGHVATIIGAKRFAFLPEEYAMPAVIAGFEPEDILTAVLRLLRQITAGKPKLENEYVRAVSENGNTLAQRFMADCFARHPACWRGLGKIDGSALKFREEYADLDAEKRFPEYLGEEAVAGLSAKAVSSCRCGEVITGKISPADCPLFARRCVPEDPVGPCMVSSEGACAAAYKYMDYDG